MASLEVYLLNVGQADTSIIKTPAGNVIVIDAVSPKKVRNAVSTIRLDGMIKHLIVTHPHNDHYRAVRSLVKHFQVQRVTLPPFDYEPGPPGYHDMVNELARLQTPIQFLSGYQRLFPDGGTYPNYAGLPELELVGPSNAILEELWESKVLNPNHLSIITRLSYGQFSAVFAADAQMENWQHYDQMGMLEKKCDVLRAAHHGSKNGNQWERVDRLNPKLVVVSSDPDGPHNLPDLVGSAIFLEYDHDEDRVVALTRDTGTIKIEVTDPNSHQRRIVAYREPAKDDVFPGQETPLRETDWAALLERRIHEPDH